MPGLNAYRDWEKQSMKEHTMTSLFAKLNQDREILLDAIRQVSDTIIDEKDVVGEWSIKNVLAHLTAWESIVAQVLPERLATGVRPELFRTISADEDAWNASEIAALESFTPQEQIRELERARQRLLEVLQNVGEDTLNRKRPWPECDEDETLADYILVEIGEHEHEHRDAILAAIEDLRRDSRV
jgi:uncharacterized damage-inducible protein DinB